MRNEVLRVEELKLEAENGSFLENVYLDLYEGEFHGVLIRDPLIRSRFMNTLLGNNRSYLGKLFYFDKKYENPSALYIRRMGVYGIHEKPHLIPRMSIAENFFLTDNRYFKFGLAKKKAMTIMAKEILREYDLQGLQAETPAQELRPSEAHSIEIIKYIAMGVRILLIDNIAERYSDKEILQLQRLFRKISDRRISVIYFTNKYTPLFDIAERVTIIHKGNTIMTLDKDHINKKEILSYYDHLGVNYKSIPYDGDKQVAISFHHVSNPEDPSLDFTFDIREGEVVGILDEDLKIRRSFLNLVFGDTPYKGKIILGKKKVNINSRKTAIKNGIVLIDENYQSSALFENMNLLDNVTLMMKGSPYSRIGLRRNRIFKYIAKCALESIDCGNLYQRYGNLSTLSHVSKHNQTKIVLAKWLCLNPKVIIMVNPFTSFDDLTEHELYELINKLCDRGIAIIIFSMNSTELKQLAQRIIPIDN